jgi:predicted RNA binding protein YcfA (HicA-like mRNA interferase family)
LLTSYGSLSMGELPVVKQTEVRAALERAGFRKIHQTGSHVKLVGRGRTVIVLQHKGRDMPRGTLRGILEQAGMSVDEFKEWLKA